MSWIHMGTGRGRGEIRHGGNTSRVSKNIDDGQARLVSPVRQSSRQDGSDPKGPSDVRQDLEIGSVQIFWGQDRLDFLERFVAD